MIPGIRYKGQPVALLPDSAINWEIQEDPIDFDFIGQGFSWPTILPREGNEHIFHFAGSYANPDQLLKTYDDFEVTTDGNVWWQVSFELTGADDLYYSGNLTAINSSFHDNRDTLIGDLINAQIDLGSGLLYDATIKVINEKTVSPVRFPYFSFYGGTLNTYPSSGNVVNKFSTYLIPTFSMVYLVREALKGIGFEFEDQFSQFNFFVKNDLNDLIMTGNKVFNGLYSTVPPTLNVAEFAPKIKLVDLLNDLAFFTGSSIYIPNDQSNKIVCRSPYRDLVQTPVKVNGDGISVSKGRHSSIKLDYNISQDELLKDGTVDELEGNFVGYYDDLAAWMASTPSEGDYALVRSVNAYYKAVMVNGTLASTFYSYPFQSYQSGTEGVKSLKPMSIPCSKNRYTHTVLDASLEIVNSGGNVRIQGFTQTPPTTSQKVMFEESNSDNVYVQSGFATITSSGADYLVLNKTYQEDVNIKQLTIQTEENYYIPIMSGAPHWPDGDQYNEDFTPRVMIWHGMRDTIDTLDDYPMASCDPYAGDGTVIGSLNLSLTITEYSLVKQVWSSMIELMSNSKIIKFAGVFTNVQLSDLSRLKVGVINGIRFRFSSLTAKLSDRGFSDQEIEGRIL